MWFLTLSQTTVCHQFYRLSVGLSGPQTGVNKLLLIQISWCDVSWSCPIKVDGKAQSPLTLFLNRKRARQVRLKVPKIRMCPYHCTNQCYWFIVGSMIWIPKAYLQFIHPKCSLSLSLKWLIMLPICVQIKAYSVSILYQRQPENLL